MYTFLQKVMLFLIDSFFIMTCWAQNINTKTYKSDIKFYDFF